MIRSFILTAWRSCSLKCRLSRLRYLSGPLVLTAMSTAFSVSRQYLHYWSTSQAMAASVRIKTYNIFPLALYAPMQCQSGSHRCLLSSRWKCQLDHCIIKVVLSPSYVLHPALNQQQLTIVTFQQTTYYIREHCTQVLATGRSRSTAKRSCVRRATDSDMYSVTASSHHPATSKALTAAGQPSPTSATTPQAGHHSSKEAQPLIGGKVQRSLTWTNEGQVGVRWGAEGGSDGGQERVHRGPDRLDIPSSGLHDDTVGTPTQEQQQQQLEQQQQDRLLGVSVQASMTVEEATSSQSSPSVQPSRHGAGLHRQRLAGNAATGLPESESGSDNSRQMLVPARFRAGTLACGLSAAHDMHL